MSPVFSVWRFDRIWRKLDVLCVAIKYAFVREHHSNIASLENQVLVCVGNRRVHADVTPVECVSPPGGDILDLPVVEQAVPL